jgi:uncharacterized protein (UPF0261 family)
MMCGEPEISPRSLKAYVVGTIDTKGEELRYVRDLIACAGIPTVLVDVGPRSQDTRCDVCSAEVAAYHRASSAAILSNDRGEAIEAMARAFSNFLPERQDVGGVIGLGGSGGSAIITPALQAMPIGVPKIMVSTLASGDVSAYVGTSDIQMINPVTDIAGLNSVSRVVLGNAAHALAGMIARPIKRLEGTHSAVGLTMYGVTTPCVRHVTDQLKPQFDCLVFHATGPGGQSMERLLESGFLSGVIDVTTSDIVDLLLGGLFAAQDDRLGAVVRTRAPYVGSCGALDMINFRAPSTVPARYQKHRTHRHNSFITLVRTTPEENRIVGKWIGEKLNQCEGPVRFLIPEKGVSALDATGQPFFDPEADEALFSAVEATVRVTGTRIVRRLPLHINDPVFGSALAQNLLEAIEQGERSRHEVPT